MGVRNLPPPEGSVIISLLRGLERDIERPAAAVLARQVLKRFDSGFFPDPQDLEALGFVELLEERWTRGVILVVHRFPDLIPRQIFRQPGSPPPKDWKGIVFSPSRFKHLKYRRSLHRRYRRQEPLPLREPFATEQEVSKSLSHLVK
jgi:hypothetical protein